MQVSSGGYPQGDSGRVLWRGPHGGLVCSAIVCTLERGPMERSGGSDGWSHMKA
jgi:hypothetical protein